MPTLSLTHAHACIHGRAIVMNTQVGRLITLTTGNTTVSFSDNGSLVVLKNGDWDLINDVAGAGIAVSFRALVPLDGATPPGTTPPRRRFNYADGLLQPSLPTVNHTDDSVVFTWRCVRTCGGTHRIVC